MRNKFIDDEACLSDDGTLRVDSEEDYDSYDFNEPDIDGLINNEVEQSQDNDEPIVFKRPKRVNPKDILGPNILGDLSQTSLSDSIDISQRELHSVDEPHDVVVDSVEVVDDVVETSVDLEYEGEVLLETPEVTKEQRDGTGKFCRKGVFSLTIHLRRLQHYVLDGRPDEQLVNGEGRGFPIEVKRLIKQCGRLNISEICGQYEVGGKTNQLHFQCMIVFHTKSTCGKEHKMSAAHLCDQIRAIVPENESYADGVVLEEGWNLFYLQALHTKSTRAKLRRYCTDPNKRYFGDSFCWSWNNGNTLSNVHSSLTGGASANVFGMINNGLSYKDICDQQPGLALMHNRTINSLIQQRREDVAKNMQARCGNQYCKYKHLSSDEFQYVSEKKGIDLEFLKQSAALGCLMKTCYSFGPGGCGKTIFSGQLSKYWSGNSVYLKPCNEYYGCLNNCYTDEKCLLINDLDSTSFANFGEFKRVIDCVPCPINIKNSSGTMVASCIVMDSNMCPCSYFEVVCREVNTNEYAAFCRRLTYIFEFSKGVTGVVSVRRVKMPSWNAFLNVYNKRRQFRERKVDICPEYVYEPNELVVGQTFRNLNLDSL